LPVENPQPHAEFKKWIPEPWWENFRAELYFTEYVIVHFSSGASTPNLNRAQYRLILRLLLEKTAYTVLLKGASGVEKFVHELADDFPQKRVKEMVERFSFAKFFSIIRNSSLLITSRTGPLHIANAAGTPLLGFILSGKTSHVKALGTI
jgi:ADP-heptose:LPS heptosyltransferase